MALTEYDKQKVADMVESFSDNLTDDELHYAIGCLAFWINERDIQNKELNEIYNNEELEH